MRYRDSSDQGSSIYPWSSFDTFWSTVGVIDDDAWSTVVHKWDVSCTVSIELYVRKCLHQDLHYIKSSAEPLSGVDFVLQCETVWKIFFFDEARHPTLWCVVIITPFYIHFSYIIPIAECKQPSSLEILERLVRSLWAIIICPLSNLFTTSVFFIARKSKWKNIS